MYLNSGVFGQCLIYPQDAKDYWVRDQEACFHGPKSFAVFSFPGGNVYHVTKMQVNPRYLSEVMESIELQEINLLITILARDGVIHEIVRDSSLWFAHKQLQIFFELTVSVWTVYSHVLFLPRIRLSTRLLQFEQRELSFSIRAEIRARSLSPPLKPRL
jgi:hypothetical protein